MMKATIAPLTGGVIIMLLRLRESFRHFFIQETNNLLFGHDDLELSSDFKLLTFVLMAGY